MTPHLSIVIPAVDEEARIQRCIGSLIAFSNTSELVIEVVLAVEACRDRTLELAWKARAGDARVRILDLGESHGKGFAVKSGILAAQGEIIAFTDVDLPVPCDEIARSCRYLTENPKVDLVIGNRHDPGSRVRRTLGRRILSAIYARYARWATDIDAPDPQCGFKAFRRHAAREIFARQTIQGYAFDLEVLALAKALEFRAQSVSVHWSDESLPGKTRVLSDAPRMLWDATTVRNRVKSSMRRDSTSAG